jgi:hypothetical protein
VVPPRRLCGFPVLADQAVNGSPTVELHVTQVGGDRLQQRLEVWGFIIPIWRRTSWFPGVCGAVIFADETSEDRFSTYRAQIHHVPHGVSMSGGR